MPKNATYFSMLAFMHRAMLIGQAFFLAFVFYLIYSRTLTPPLTDQVKILQLAALLISGAAIGLAINLFKKKLIQIKENNALGKAEKLAKYRSALMLQWGVTELPTFVCGICLMLSGNYAFLALAIVVIVYFAMLMPVKNRIAAQLHIQPEEMDSL